MLCPWGTSSPVPSTKPRGAWAARSLPFAPSRPRPCWFPAPRNKRSATLCNSPSPVPPCGAKSSTTNRASLAENASNSRAFPVEAKLAGRRLASMAAPKCCWQSAASALLKTPLGPLRKTLKLTPPNAARYTAASSGKLTRSFAALSKSRLACIARASSSACGGTCNR